MKITQFTLWAGVGFILIGILGFIPGVTQMSQMQDPSMGMDHNYDRLLGLFPVNFLHNLVHIGLGIWAVMAAKTNGSSVFFCRVSAIVYGLLTIMGLIPGLNTLFGLIPLFGHDVWLHALIAAAIAYFGFAPETRKTPTKTAIV